jgi:hypothetical protein
VFLNGYPQLPSCGVDRSWLVGDVAEVPGNLRFVSPPQEPASHCWQSMHAAAVESQESRGMIGVAQIDHLSSLDHDRRYDTRSRKFHSKSDRDFAATLSRVQGGLGISGDCVDRSRFVLVGRIAASLSCTGGRSCAVAYAAVSQCALAQGLLRPVPPAGRPMLGPPLHISVEVAPCRPTETPARRENVIRMITRTPSERLDRISWELPGSDYVWLGVWRLPPVCCGDE